MVDEPVAVLISAKTPSKAMLLSMEVMFQVVVTPIHQELSLLE